MRVILGLDAPDAGTALIGGRPYRELHPPLCHVGSLLDAAALQPGRSARNHLLWLAYSQGLKASRVDLVIEQTGLAKVARRKAGGFSLGMRQRLGIAAAMLGDPPVLMFDEPVTGLDPEGIVWIRGYLRSLAGEGRAVLDGFAQVLRSEWVKFWTVRGWVVGLVVAAVLTAGLTLVLASAGRPGGPGSLASVATGPGGIAVNDNFYFVHRSLAGNGSITVRVTSADGCSIGNPAQISQLPGARAAAAAKSRACSPAGPGAANRWDSALARLRYLHRHRVDCGAGDGRYAWTRWTSAAGCGQLWLGW